jgi:hypothetical protein
MFEHLFDCLLHHLLILVAVVVQSVFGTGTAVSFGVKVLEALQT